MPIARSQARNILFIHIPKTGGTSIEEWLRQRYALSLHASQVDVAMRCPPQHFHADLLKYLFQDGYFDYSFAVVRNPYTRLLSEYNYRMSHRRRRERIFPTPSFAAWLRRTFERYRKDSYIYSNHIRPQQDFLLDDTEVFTLESGLEKMKSRLAEVLGEPLPGLIPVSKQSAVRSRGMDEQTANALFQFYRGDFERFGYDRDSYPRLP